MYSIRLSSLFFTGVIVFHLRHPFKGSQKKKYIIMMESRVLCVPISIPDRWFMGYRVVSRFWTFDNGQDLRIFWISLNFDIIHRYIARVLIVRIYPRRALSQSWLVGQRTDSSPLIPPRIMDHGVPKLLAWVIASLQWNNSDGSREGGREMCRSLLNFFFPPLLFKNLTVKKKGARIELRAKRAS